MKYSAQDIKNFKIEFNRLDMYDSYELQLFNEKMTKDILNIQENLFLDLLQLRCLFDSDELFETEINKNQGINKYMIELVTNAYCHLKDTTLSLEINAEKRTVSFCDILKNDRLLEREKFHQLAIDHVKNNFHSNFNNALRGCFTKITIPPIALTERLSAAASGSLRGFSFASSLTLLTFGFAFLLLPIPVIGWSVAGLSLTFGILNGIAEVFSSQRCLKQKKLFSENYSHVSEIANKSEWIKDSYVEHLTLSTKRIVATPSENTHVNNDSKINEKKYVNSAKIMYEIGFHSKSATLPVNNEKPVEQVSHFGFTAKK